MANRIKGITVEIGGDTTGLEKALKSVNTTIKSTQSALKDVNKLLKLDPSNTELLSQKQKLLKDAIGATKEKLDSLKQAQEDLARTDSLLQAVTHDYNYQKTKVDKDREQLRATEEELSMFNKTKQKLDSLKVRFDMQCAKIKYIHKKQKEDIK